MNSRPDSLIDRHCEEVAARLSAIYHDWSHHNLQDPFDELLFIMCSIKTSESVYLRVYQQLRYEFPTPESLLCASEECIAESLAIGGLSQQKAGAIRRLTAAVVDRLGRPSLEPLRQLNDAQCEEFLTSLPGVGKKVARCVMMYSLGRRTLPVDTHCWRMLRRLGWFRPTAKDRHCTPRDMDRIQSAIPEHLRFSLHVNFISHGRSVCHARRPACERCVLFDLCLRVGVIEGGDKAIA